MSLLLNDPEVIALRQTGFQGNVKTAVPIIGNYCPRYSISVNNWFCNFVLLNLIILNTLSFQYIKKKKLIFYLHFSYSKETVRNQTA